MNFCPESILLSAVLQDTRSNSKQLGSSLITALFTCWVKFVVTLRQLEIPQHCHHTLLQYGFVILSPFLVIKNAQEEENTNKLAELDGCSGVFSVVPVVSVPGNAPHPQALFYRDSKSFTAFPRAALAS